MFRSRITTVILLVVVAWAGLLAVGSSVRSRAARIHLATLQSRVGELERENNRRSVELERMHDPEWLALLARSRLNYKLPDEAVVFVYKNEKSGTIVPPVPTPESRPNWRLWLDWLIGK